MMNEQAYFAQFASWDTESDFADRAEAWLKQFNIHPTEMRPESETTCSAIVTMQEYIESDDIPLDTLLIADHMETGIGLVELFIWHVSEWYKWAAQQWKADAHARQQEGGGDGR